MFDLFDSICSNSVCLSRWLFGHPCVLLSRGCEAAASVARPSMSSYTGKLVFHWDWPLTLLLCVCVCVCQWDGLWRKRSGYPYTVLEWGALGVAFTDWTPLCYSDVFNPLEICLHPFSFPLALLVLLKAFSENDMEWWKGMCNGTQCTIKSHIFHRDRIEAEKTQTIKEALTYSYIILKRSLIMVAIKGCNIFIMFFSLSKKFLTFNTIIVPYS